MNNTKQNQFVKGNEAITNKVNPRMNRSNFQQKKYNSVRVHPNDFEYLKAYAFYKKMAIIDVIALGLEALREKEAEREDGLEVLKSEIN